MRSFAELKGNLCSPEAIQEQSDPKLSRDSEVAASDVTNGSNTDLRARIDELERRLREAEATDDNPTGAGEIERIKSELRAMAVPRNTEQMRRPSRRRRRRVYLP